MLTHSCMPPNRRSFAMFRTKIDRSSSFTRSLYATGLPNRIRALRRASVSFIPLVRPDTVSGAAVQGTNACGLGGALR